MYTNEFEEAFADFLDRHEYDEAENYLFSMVRLAFPAGWKAAGGEPPKSQRIFELLPGGQGRFRAVDRPGQPLPEEEDGDCPPPAPEEGPSP